ncbi:hypothetical protein PLESTF_000315000 [Pleodorina starrii]|nr:hypothetical protein PLESTF_000315000 [Pleodorina starrii]
MVACVLDRKMLGARSPEPGARSPEPGDLHSHRIGETSTQHPCTEYYRGVLFMDMGGYRVLLKNLEAPPPTDEEVGQLACVAPLPEGFEEIPDDTGTGAMYRDKESNIMLDEHPLDVYFWELRRLLASIKAMQVALEDREREERSGGGSRGGDGAAAARRHRSLDAWVEGEGEPDRNGAAKADSDGTAKMTRRRERRWITSAAPALRRVLMMLAANGGELTSSTNCCTVTRVHLRLPINSPCPYRHPTSILGLALAATLGRPALEVLESRYLKGAGKTDQLQLHDKPRQALATAYLSPSPQPLHDLSPLAAPQPDGGAVSLEDLMALGDDDWRRPQPAGSE